MHKIVLAITGASGSIYPKLLLDRLLTMKDQWSDLAVVMTQNAKLVWKTELGDEEYDKYAVKFYDTCDCMFSLASVSGKFDTMIIAPCSMGTLSRIATVISTDLITRAADVILKERRKLICMIRDTPYNLIHIRNMETVTLAGGIICPATPSFYSRPATIEAVAATVTDRILDLAGFTIPTFMWADEKNSPQS